MVALSYRQKELLPANVEIVRYGDLRQMGWVDALGFIVSVLLSPGRFARVFRVVPASKLSTRLKLAIRFFPLTRPKEIDVIHIQWLGHVPDLYWLKSFYNARMIASVRGSQVTVYPHSQPGFTQIIRNAFRLADSFHLVSHDLLGPSLALGAESKKLFVNYNGIDLFRFKPVPGLNLHQGLKLISVGALMWRKAYYFQLLVVRQLIMSGSTVSLIIVGAGPDREGLKHTARVFGVEDAVSFTGQLPEAEVIAKLREADVYLSTSLAEGLPNSLVEAAACGLPIVAFACEGIREIVAHGATGYVVPAGDTDAMVQYVQRLQEETGRLEMGKCARTHIERYFNQDECVEEMIEHYKRIVNGG